MVEQNSPMIPPQLTPDEPVRLAALRSTNLLDSPVEERFDRITRLVARAFNVPIAVISLVDAGRQWFKSAVGTTTCETSRDVSFCGHTILSPDGFMIIPDARVDPRFHDNPFVTGSAKLVFYAGCPLTAEDGSRIGVLCINDTRPRTMTQDEIDMFRDFASLAENELRASVATSINTDILAQLAVERRRSMIDPLTRLWNREGISETLNHALNAPIKNAGIAVAVVDIDHFKSINDTHGHPIGDEVLSHVARRMLASIRSNDAIGRFGGEEFLVVISTCPDAHAASVISENLRRCIACSTFTQDKLDITVTISVGVAFAPDRTAVDAATMIRVADEALYAAKNAGRNRIHITEMSPAKSAA
ncbi:MAG TPA: sensor domain-containing diguanylate cyclase [Phycisphaerales bacterium]|nr:sensor domain-containing diguanylate cyclase [Phycisphaerales bacterium]